MFAILLAASPFIASFFKNQDAIPVLILIAVVPLLRGFINPSIVFFQKDQIE